jgi:hypothetical protein
MKRIVFTAALLITTPVYAQSWSGGDSMGHTWNGFCSGGACSGGDSMGNTWTGGRAGGSFWGGDSRGNTWNGFEIDPGHDDNDDDE